MPILKVKILGFQIEINYEEKEHKKLLNLIDNFKERLSEFSINGKYQNHKIMFLAALKVEDEIYDKTEKQLRNIDLSFKGQAGGGSDYCNYKDLKRSLKSP